jgi:hypothetical protein
MLHVYLQSFVMYSRALLDILRADGIAPLDPASQRSAPDKRKADVIENQDGDEEEDDGEEERAEVLIGGSLALSYPLCGRSLTEQQIVIPILRSTVQRPTRILRKTT